MIYNKFNKYIYDYFFKKENYGETVIMAVDELVMNDFYIQFKTTKNDLRKEIIQRFWFSWRSAFTIEKGIPQLFGLVAIQIYEAFLMQNNVKFSAREYNPRLEKYLNISTNELQTIYAKFQDKLWHELELRASKNGFKMSIPDIGYGTGRYTQYPLSQALLNQDDLTRIPFLFQNAGIKPDEYLVFEDFVSLIEHADRNIHLSNNYYRVKQKLLEQNKKQLLFLQLFGFFNNDWDGSCQVEIKNDKRENNYIEKSQTYLTICNDVDKLKILNKEYECIQEYSLDENQLLENIKKYYNPFHQEVLIFISKKSYDEWIDCRYLEPKGEHIVICKINSRAEASIYNLDSNYTKFPNPYFSIFKVSLSNEISNHFYWKSFFSRKLKNYTVENGLKLSRNIWMYGAGPSIKFFRKTDAWVNGEKLTFNNDELSISCKDYEEGSFRLKVKGFPPEKFQIKKPKVASNTDLCGWQINESESLWEYSAVNYQISGISTSFPFMFEKASVRTWANAITQKTNKNKNSSIVINAIKRSKNGV